MLTNIKESVKETIVTNADFISINNFGQNEAIYVLISIIQHIFSSTTELFTTRHLLFMQSQSRNGSAKHQLLLNTQPRLTL